MKKIVISGMLACMAVFVLSSLASGDSCTMIWDGSIDGNVSYNDQNTAEMSFFLEGQDLYGTFLSLDIYGSIIPSDFETLVWIVDSNSNVYVGRFYSAGEVAIHGYFTSSRGVRGDFMCTRR